MASGSKPIVFFGTEDFSLVALKALVEAGYPVVAVVTKPDAPKGRGHQVIPPAVKVYAEEHNIPVWQPAKLSDIHDDIAALDNPTGVLVSYGKIIPQSLLDLFTPGIINLHPSLLPKYRGPSPIESAIIGGDKETGVSIMKLSAAMDAGPVYRQLAVTLTGSETAEELYENLGAIGANLLVEILPSIIEGALVPEEQNDTEATYCQIIKKSDGIIDWNESAKTIESHVRAYLGWPQSRTQIGKVDVVVTKAGVAEMGSATPGRIMAEKSRLFIGTSQDWLEITALKPLGKKEMPVEAFLAGYRSQIDI